MLSDNLLAQSQVLHLHAARFSYILSLIEQANKN